MDIFSKYNWTTLTLDNIVKYKTAETGRKLNTFGRTNLYQLGIKFGGSTEIYYNKKKYMYNDSTIIYLPKETKKRY